MRDAAAARARRRSSSSPTSRSTRSRRRTRLIAAGAVDALKDLAVTYLEQEARDRRRLVRRSAPAARRTPTSCRWPPSRVDDLAERRVVARVEGAAPVPGASTTRRSARCPTSTTWSPSTPATSARRRSRPTTREALGAGGEVLQHLPARDAQRASRCAPPTTCSTSIASWPRSARRRRAQHDAASVEIAGYFRYYGQIAHGMDLGFVTETVAYDLATLCETRLRRAARRRTTRSCRLLLELDKEAETGEQEHMLRGVRKAQAKLATLLPRRRRASEHARQIADDMKDERPSGCARSATSCWRIESKDFWEVIDRGTNFDYLDEARKAQLAVFFGWFPALTGRRDAGAAAAAPGRRQPDEARRLPAEPIPPARAFTLSTTPSSACAKASPRLAVVRRPVGGRARPEATRPSARRRAPPTTSCVALARGGDRPAFEALVRRHQRTRDRLRHPLLRQAAIAHRRGAGRVRRPAARAAPLPRRGALSALPLSAHAQPLPHDGALLPLRGPGARAPVRRAATAKLPPDEAAPRERERRLARALARAAREASRGAPAALLGRAVARRRSPRCSGRAWAP